MAGKKIEFSITLVQAEDSQATGIKIGRAHV